MAESNGTNPIYQGLIDRALRLQREPEAFSHTTRTQFIDLYGQAKMAFQLRALTREQFERLNAEIAVYCNSHRMGF